MEEVVETVRKANSDAGVDPKVKIRWEHHQLTEVWDHRIFM
jgi:hypothetical protein